MPLSAAVSGLFSGEWARFQEGYDKLVEVERAEYLRAYRRSRAGGDGSTLVSVPGWSEIVRTNTAYQPTADEAREFYRARAQKRAPDLPPFVRQELERRRAVKERIARAPEPAYAQGFGSILTAIDNVQDFMSTIATTGRLALWGAPALTQAIFPGASAGTAEALAQVAARRAAATAGAEFAATVAERAAAGNLVARLAAADTALFAAARREAVETAAQTAYRLAFSRATLGLAGRAVARFVPILGWVILASDLLNLLSFLAMLATPTYALLCQGPQAAVAAGVPAALFKQALKRETWRAHNLNPFSRKAVATRALRSAGRLPSVSNLVEVAQTADQLFGIGLSLGGAVGLINGATFGLYEWSQGRSVTFQGPPEFARRAPDLRDGSVAVDPELRRLLANEVKYATSRPKLPPSATGRMVQQANAIAIAAPAIHAVQDLFDEDDHVLALMATHEALALLRRLAPGDQTAQLIPAALDAQWEAPLSVAPDTAMWAEATGRDLDRGRRWWFGAGREYATGADYVTHHATAVPRALGDFLLPRRAAPVAALYGGLVDQTMQTAWLLAEDDPHLFRFELTSDARLVSDFSESGYILASGQAEAVVWRWWQAARRELEAASATSLRPGRWQALADAFGVQIIPLLPPEAAVPAAWPVGPPEA